MFISSVQQVKFPFNFEQIIQLEVAYDSSYVLLVNNPDKIMKEIHHIGKKNKIYELTS